MDDIVRAALRKWPTVPDCYGWLGLDARGDWYMRDDAVQAAGPFPQVKGSRLQHAALCAFIGRNYEATADGRWFFQNGPQRVYVELEVAPLVLGVQRMADDFVLRTNTDADPGPVLGTWTDELGRLFVQTASGLGLLRSLDMDCAADAVLVGRWSPQPVQFAELPGRFGYVLSPARSQH